LGLVGSSLIAGCSSAGDRPVEATAATSEAVSSSSATVTSQTTDPQTASFLSAAATVVNVAGSISKVFGVIPAAVAVAQVLGILNDPNQDLLNELHNLSGKIDAVAATIVYFDNQSKRDDRLTLLRGNVIASGDKINSGGTPDWGTIDPNTLTAVDEGATPSAFERDYVDSDTNGSPVNLAFPTDLTPEDAIGFTWKDVISYVNNDPNQGIYNDNGLVYDWRLALPAFLQLVGLRLTLMAMEDPNFATDHRFQIELEGHRNLLLHHLDRLNKGLQCNSVGAVESDCGYGFTSAGCGKSPPIPPAVRYVYKVACADIYTGLNETVGVICPDSNPCPSTAQATL
jgi:hypothetical protein